MGETKISKNISLRIGMTYIKCIASSKFKDNIILSLIQDYPLKIEQQFGKKSYIRMFIAPKIEE